MKVLSEALKVNTSLIKLNLSCDLYLRHAFTSQSLIVFSTGNGIGNIGLKALSDSLMVNSSITSLNLICLKDSSKNRLFEKKIQDPNR